MSGYNVHGVCHQASERLSDGVIKTQCLLFKPEDGLNFFLLEYPERGALSMNSEKAAFFFLLGNQDPVLMMQASERMSLTPCWNWVLKTRCRWLLLLSRGSQDPTSLFQAVKSLRVFEMTLK